MRLPIARGVDYANAASANPDCLVRQGMAFVCRYLTLPGPSFRWKALTDKEAERLSWAGLNIISVFQARNTQAEDFSPANVARDAEAALRSAEAVGQPTGSAIYFAVDFDATGVALTTVLGYLGRVKRALGNDYRTGVYGSYGVVEAALSAGVVDLAWQTYAWSGGKLHDRAALFQFQNGIKLCGTTADLNYAFADPGWWRVGGTLAPKPGIHLRPLVLGSRGWDVGLLQELLKARGFDPGPVDGIFGPKTAAAVSGFRTDGRAVVDEAAWQKLLTHTGSEAERLRKELEQLRAERDYYRTALEQIAATIRDTLATKRGG